MIHFLYDKSVSYKGYLIIPFLFSRVESCSIYSYALLSELGHKSKFHTAINPVGLYSSNISNIVNIAQRHIDENVGEFSALDYFHNRYTYQNNLIIIHEAAGKCFYDHYRSEELKNIAAPKIFQSANDCITWVKQGLNRGSQRKV